MSDPLAEWRKANPNLLKTQPSTHNSFICYDLERWELTGPAPFLVAVDRVKQLRSMGKTAWWEEL